MNSVTRDPVARAMVYSLDERNATITDDHGRFELNLAPDTAVIANVQIGLEARRPGFRSRGSSMVGAGQGDVTLWLLPDGLITGKVKFPSDDPGDHVQVQLYHREIRDGTGQWVPASRERTRADGEFRFAELAAGDYKVFTMENMEQGQPTEGGNEPPWGFPPRFYPGMRDFGSAETIHLSAGETFVANISLERQRYYDVRVPVVGMEEGMPQGVRVSVYAQGHRGPGYELGFNGAQGAVTGLLPNGTYTIEATGSGPHPTTGSTNITVANRAVMGPALAVVANPPIEVNIRKDLSGVDSSAKQGVVASSGVPAQVSLISADEVVGRRGVTSQAQGDPLTMSGVAPGWYWVQVRPFGGYVAGVMSGGKDLLREPLVVPNGASVPPIDITLRYDTGELEVMLEGGDDTGSVGIGGGSTGVMVQGQWVYCLPLDGNIAPTDLGQMGVRSNGRSTSMQIPPGNYRVLAFKSPQELEYRNPTAMKKFESQGQVVKVLPGQKSQVTVKSVESE